MKTVRKNIQLIIDAHKIIRDTQIELEYLISNQGTDGISDKGYEKINKLFSTQDDEINNLRYLIGDLIETFVGEGNSKSFMGIN